MMIDLTAALADHRRGDLDRAGTAYEAILAVEPERDQVLYLLGLVVLQRGEVERACRLFSRAAVIRPEAADYHLAQSEAYRMLGEMERAVASCREAIRLRPDSPECRCNLGSLLVDQGQLDAGIAEFREALRVHPNFAVAHGNLGNAQRLRGALDEAAEHYRAALRLAPGSAEFQASLGQILMDQGDALGSLRHLAEAVRLNPRFAAAWISLGNAQHVLGRLDASETSFRTAIGLLPGSATAHASLGIVLEQKGELEASLASYRAALARDPRHAETLGRLAIRLGAELPEADLTNIEQLLAEPGLAPDQRGSLLFGLARTHDARGDHPRAYHACQEANALQKERYERRGKTYDAQAYSGFVDAMLAGFSREFLGRITGWGLDSERPIFVVGLPRSGTSLVEQILASHPRVAGAGESRLIRESLDRLPSLVGSKPAIADALERLTPGALSELARQYLDALSARAVGAERVVDKMPENYVYLGWIVAMFPRATLIHCRRDPRDVAMSCWMTQFGQLRWTCDLDHIVARIEHHARIMRHWGAVLPSPVFEMAYESIVADLETSVRRLLTHCGLEWSPACLEFHRTVRPVQTASVAQVRQPIYRRSVGRWRHYAKELAPVFDRLAPLAPAPLDRTS